MIEADLSADHSEGSGLTEAAAQSQTSFPVFGHNLGLTITQARTTFNHEALNFALAERVQITADIFPMIHHFLIYCPETAAPLLSQS